MSEQNRIPNDDSGIRQFPDTAPNSDTVSVPKRENPYLRKKKETSQEPQRMPPSPAPNSGNKRPRRTFSDFLFEHVKLITAIISILVLVGLVVATDVVSFVEDMVHANEQAGKKPLTLTYVEGLTKKSDPVTWSDLEGFVRYAQSEVKDSVTWFFKVEGTPYEIWISGVSTDREPTYVKLFDMMTGGEMDIRKGNLDKFMEENPLPEN